MKFITDTGIEITEEYLFSDEKKEKLILIEDIVKIKKTLFGFGYTHHSEFLTDNGRVNLFDELYEMDIEVLKIILASYEERVNGHVRRAMTL